MSSHMHGSRLASHQASDAGVLTTRPKLVRRASEDVLPSLGQPLTPAEQAFFSARFRFDFSRIRLHTDRRAAESARSLNARAYTVGQDVVFGANEYPPQTPSGRQLLAHELVHAQQQQGAQPGPRLAVGSPEGTDEQQARDLAQQVVRTPLSKTRINVMRGLHQQLIQRDNGHEAPTRFGALHHTVFEEAPPGGRRSPGELLEWNDAAAELIMAQVREALVRRYERPITLPRRGGVTEGIARDRARADARSADQSIRDRFPFIRPENGIEALSGVASQAESDEPSETETGRVNIITAETIQDPHFLRRWLANMLPEFSEDFMDYRIDTEPEAIDDPESPIRELLDALVNDEHVNRITGMGGGGLFQEFTTAELIRGMASRQTAFVESSGVPGEWRAFFHPMIPPEMRMGTLIHEFVHVYTSERFREWIMQVDHGTPWLEGFTEYLARIVMDDHEADLRADGHAQVVWDAVNTRVAPHAPDDDIARAYFLGEVWRLEAISPVAQSLFAEQVGLRQETTRREEVADSRRSPGIVQTVASGRHYRFMNLAIDRPEPKSEHVTAWREIQGQYIANHPLMRVRFEGHASSPGTLSDNLELARRRAEAFYQLARDEGLGERQLIDAEDPPHHGESRPTAAEAEQADVHARAFNRRVELTVTSSGQ